MAQEKILGNQLNIPDVASDVAADPSAVASLEGTIDHANIVNGGGTNSHADIDAHIAQGSPAIHNTFTDIVQDTTPQLGGDLDVNGNDIVGAVNLTSASGVVGQGLLQFWDYTDTGHTTGNYIALKAPVFIGSPPTNITYVLPEFDGGEGEPLQTDGSGNLSFGTGPVTLPKYTVSALPLVIEGGQIYVTDATTTGGTGVQCFGRGVGSPLLTEWVDVITGIAVV